ncbi:hypothetical protein BOTBODRAFT_412276 [Botryobasidium botryosum FD-172 SS1]|uniref:Autophagy-related protein n=1 Tax=Botryobasidium botryosum (strain FD-172 SS1) TaxID=930990 RepID=A0A067MCX3_BOTB1|nr:hypothetical protein BOTBODRAFT_412276 [Botryobasidium botryosum FD-172 SS1]
MANVRLHHQPQDSASLEGASVARNHEDLSQRKKLWGWLSYAFASEVFAVCSLTLFLPICLEQFARDNGYLLPDRTVPCASASPLAAALDPPRCVVKIGWLWMDSASFSLYVYSASVAIQALTVISLGGVADHPPHRKKLLLSFAWLGAGSAALFFILPSTSPLWTLSAVLAILANVSFGTSIVALNAYLPGLARGTAEVRQAWEEAEKVREESQNDYNPIEETELLEGDSLAGAIDVEREPLAHTTVSPQYKTALENYHRTLARATSHISSLGIALGYASGIALLLIILVPVTLLKSSTFALRLAIGMSGVWWAVFTVPAALWLPGGNALGGADEGARAGGATAQLTSLPSQQKDGGWSMSTEILGAWKRLGQMLHPTEMKKLNNTFWFLLAWFLLSDGFTTITSTAVLFAKTTLHMPASSLVLIGVLVPSAGILGSLLWPRLQRRLAWTNLHALVLLVVMAALIPLYGCLGFLWGVIGWKVRFGGLTSPEEMFVIAIYFGSLYGAFQSYARTVFAELIPPGEEARWYGLYSITDKSSSFIGPLVVGIIADATGNIRFAFFFLVFMLLIPIPVLTMKVDVDQGREDARIYVLQRQDREVDDESAPLVGSSEYNS